MTIELVRPQSFDETLGILTSLGQKFPREEYVFRGQQDSAWRLCTTYERYWAGRPIHGEPFVEKMVHQFRSGLNRLGLKVSIDDDRLAWLEYARHHGLPAPLLDFSWSPFVALYFAFDGIRAHDESSSSSVIYCVNLEQLAKEAARLRTGTIDSLAFSRAREDFLYRDAERFKEGFPMGELLFIREPSVHTRRMHAQFGVFLYYTMGGISQPAAPHDLEELLENAQEGFDSPCLPNKKEPVLKKILLPHSWISDVFNHLDLINVNGSSMLLTAEGVARDVYNSFNYRPRAAFLRDKS